MSELNDRELDVEIATRVMGWSRLTEGEIYPNTFDDVYPCAASAGFNRSRLSDWWFDAANRNEKGEATAMRSAEEPDSPDESPRFAPATDISAAIEVIEKMRENGFVVLMRCLNKWYVEFSPRTVNPSQNVGRAQHESLSRAICLAALSTVGEKPVTYSREDIYHDHD